MGNKQRGAGGCGKSGGRGVQARGQCSGQKREANCGCGRGCGCVKGRGVNARIVHHQLLQGKIWKIIKNVKIETLWKLERSGV